LGNSTAVSLLDDYCLDNPKSVLWDTYNKLAYKVSNYKHPVIGYRETIENFTGELVRNYFNTHYVPSVMNIVVVGKVDKDEVIKKIRETFGTVKKKEYTPPPVPLEPEQKEIREKTLKKNQVFLRKLKKKDWHRVFLEVIWLILEQGNFFFTM